MLKWIYFGDKGKVELLLYVISENKKEANNAIKWRYQRWGFWADKCMCVYVVQFNVIILPD